MIHWKRRKKIQDTLEALKKNPRKKVVLSDKQIADMEAYLKRYYVPPKKSKASALAYKGAGGKAYFSSSKEPVEFAKKGKNQVFAEYLKKELTERGRTANDLYILSGRSRLVKTIISGGANTQQPDKNTVFLIGIAIQMNLDEMRGLLAAAGFVLSRSEKEDSVIKFCIEEKIWDINEVDERMSKFTGKSLSGK